MLQQEPPASEAPDGIINEREALQQAHEQGVHFVDEFTVVKISDFSRVSNAYATREEAEKVFKDKFNDPELYTISQSRKQI